MHRKGNLQGSYVLEHEPLTSSLVQEAVLDLQTEEKWVFVNQSRTPNRRCQFKHRKEYHCLLAQNAPALLGKWV